MELGSMLQSLRRAKGDTQEVLAAELGVTVGAVSKWENNASLPDVFMLCSIADYFGVSTDKLLGRSVKRSFAVCDDAAFIRESVNAIMIGGGYECAWLARSGGELYGYLKKREPDILFLDLHFPDESGLDMLSYVKKTHGDIKVVVITADTSPETRDAAMTRGADAYVTKPFLPEHILASLA